MGYIKMSSFPKKLQLNGNELIIALDGNKNISITIASLLEFLNIQVPSGMGGVVPNDNFVPEMGSPEHPAIYFAIGGTPEEPVILPGFGGISLVDPLNIISWNGNTATAKGIPIKIPEPDISGLVQETEYQTDIKNRFNKDEEQLFQSANYPVRRYMTGDAITNYSPGYRQTATPNGLQMDIPASGTTSIKHYIQTNFTPIGTTLVEFSLNGTGALETSGVGVGYIADNGNYVGFYLSGSGQFRKVVNYGQVFAATASGGYGNGETVVFQIQDNTLTIKKGDSTLYSYPLEENELTTPLLIMQAGFPLYIFKAESKIAPIDDYVKAQISEAIKGGTLPKCFYRYDPTGVDNPSTYPNTGLFTAFVNIGKNYYSGFHVGHEVDMRELQWKDYWRIRNASVYEYNGYDMIDTGMRTLHDGESECVWKRNSNKDDFTGGTHGDEIANEVTFFADGVEIFRWVREEPGASNPGFPAIPLTACGDLRYIVISTMHETANKDLVPIPGHPVECFHNKDTWFGDFGFETTNELLKWVPPPATMTLWYHGICCVHVNFAAKIYSEDYEEYDLEGETEGFPRTEGFREVRFRNDANKTSAYVTSRITKIKTKTMNEQSELVNVDRTELKDSTAELFVSDRSTGEITGDAKYYREMSPTTTYPDDYYQSKMKVQFKIS